MNLWTEVNPQGSNVWLMPRDMYDCVCLCAMNKSGKDVVVEVDYSDSRGAVSMGGGSEVPSSAPAAGSIVPMGAAGLQLANSGGGDGSGKDKPSAANATSSSLLTTRSYIATKQSTIIAVFRPETPFMPMQVSYRSYLVAVAKKEDEPAVDAEGTRLLTSSTQQSAEVENWLRSRRK